MTGLSVTGGPHSWTAYDGADPVGTLRWFVRPDRRCVVSFRDCRDDAYRPLLAAAVAALPRDLYTHVDERYPEARRRLVALGFVPNRLEDVYRIPVDPVAARLVGVAPPPDVDIISAADADLDRLRALDDVLRQEIPGCDGWEWSAESFQRETFSEGFHPATYLVAVERDTDRYVGLIRAWIKAAEPHLGCLAVLPGARRGHITRALVAIGLAALHRQGHTGMLTTIDATNRAALALARRMGGQRVGGVHELVRAAAVVAPS